MILTWLLPGSLTRPIRKNPLERRLQFLQSVIDDGQSGQSLHESFQRHHYPDLADSNIEKFFTFAVNNGMSLLPALQEMIRETNFRIEREREIAIEIAPAQATLKLLTYLPLFILIGAWATGIIELDRNLLAPIPMAMITLSIFLQVLGRRWAESIITNVRS